MKTKKGLFTFAHECLGGNKLFDTTGDHLLFLWENNRLPAQPEPWPGPTGRTTAGAIWALYLGKKHPEEGFDHDAGQRYMELFAERVR